MRAHVPQLSLDSDLELEHDSQESSFDDPNLDPNQTTEFDDDSPYPEVRSAVANTDDSSIPAMTLRTWVLGLMLAVLMAGINQFLFFRYPNVPIGATTAQLVSFPLGRLWASYVPRKRIFGISLNPGPFSIKEHVLITVGVLSRVVFFPYNSFSHLCRSWLPWEHCRLTQ